MGSMSYIEHTILYYRIPNEQALKQPKQVFVISMLFPCVTDTHGFSLISRK